MRPTAGSPCSSVERGQVQEGSSVWEASAGPGPLPPSSTSQAFSYSRSPRGKLLVASSDSLISQQPPLQFSLTKIDSQCPQKPRVHHHSNSKHFPLMMDDTGGGLIIAQWWGDVFISPSLCLGNLLHFLSWACGGEGFRIPPVRQCTSGLGLQWLFGTRNLYFCFLPGPLASEMTHGSGREGRTHGLIARDGSETNNLAVSPSRVLERQRLKLR